MLLVNQHLHECQDITLPGGRFLGLVSQQLSRYRFRPIKVHTVGTELVSEYIGGFSSSMRCALPLPLLCQGCQLKNNKTVSLILKSWVLNLSQNYLLWG